MDRLAGFGPADPGSNPGAPVDVDIDSGLHRLDCDCPRKGEESYSRWHTVDVDAEAEWERHVEQRLEGPPPETPPETLYHYTTAAGFLRIMRSGRLSASHVRFMADPLEVSYGRKLLTDTLHELAGDWKHRDLEEFEEQILFFSQTHPTMIPPVFAVCFSQRDDDMSQWDRYGGQGYGYALGFSSDGLRRMRKTGSQLFDSASLHRIVYRQADQAARMRSLLTPALQLWHAARADINLEVRRSKLAILSHHLALYVLETLSCFKHPGYDSEEEWRLIYTKGPHVHDPTFDAEYRESSRGLVPYVELESESVKLPLTRVLCGPRIASLEARMAAISALRHNGYKAHAEQMKAVRRLLGAQDEPVFVTASGLTAHS